MSQNSLSLNRPGGNIAKRRNGLQPACESCRKAKVRCDITTFESACSRCSKRKKPSECIVLEAPMSKSRRETTIPRAASPIQMFAQTPAQSATSSLPSHTPGSNPSTFCQKSETSGYLGLTSYSSTLHHSGLEPSNEGSADVERGEKRDFDPREVALGVHILKHVPHEKTAHLFLDLYFENTVGVIGVPKEIVKQIITSMFVAFGPAFKYPWNEEELEKTSKYIIQNGQKSLTEPDDPNDWASKDQIRWDIIGIIFVAFAYALLSSNHKDYALIDEHIAHRDRKACVREFKRCIEGCVELSRNSLCPRFVNLIYKHLHLETVLEGDSSLSVWRLHHDLVAASTAIGLHCYQGTPNVTLQSEMTKRVSAVCFSTDKDLAMFTGRPPALSHRYVCASFSYYRVRKGCCAAWGSQCARNIEPDYFYAGLEYTCPLPLDIHNDVLIQGGEVLQREIEDLDEDGWNRKGEVHDGTICRLMVLSAMIQDEIMELFIGNPAYFSMERVYALKARTIKTFAAVRHLTHVTKEQLAAFESIYFLWRLLFGRLDYLRIHFLLERLSVERGHESKQKLLDVSREMVDLTVFLWLQRDRTMNRHYDFDYIIMCYGMPSTGILCAELIKQIRYPKTVDVKLPCSEVVQNLSLMIGFLEWIKPEAGNYKLCQHMSQVIKRVLEHTFDPPPVKEVPPADQQLQGFDANFWGLDGTDDFDWLNSIDWGRGQFPDMAG